MLGSLKKVDLKYKSCVASTSDPNTIEKVLKKSPKMLHFYIKFITDARVSVTEVDKKQNYLVFQNKFLVSEYVADSKLKRLLTRYYSNAGKKLELVFISLCRPEDAEIISNIFLESGARHVICTLQNSATPNNSLAQKFTYKYYEAVFKEQESLCDAFYSTIKTLIEVERTLQVDDVDSHFVCYSNHATSARCFHYDFSNSHPSSTYRDHTKRPKYRIPSPLDPHLHFHGLEYHLPNIFSVLSNNSIAYITGPPRIGKSTLLQLTTIYLLEAQSTKDGVIYIDLKGKESYTEFILNLREKLENHLLNYEGGGGFARGAFGERRLGFESSCSVGSVMDDADYEFLNEMIAEFRDKEFVLAVDNFDEVWEKDQQEVR